ncbi:hypothetical protein Ndes2526B_g00742 [Nannochloris sp. 'desiccata']
MQVKKKGGRDLNPMDAFRKAERAKQVSKNKKGRQLQREAAQHTSDPAALRQQLKEILDLEQELEGGLNPTMRLKKKALQQAYNQAIQKQMEKEAAAAAHPRPTNSDALHYGAGGSEPFDGPSTSMLPPLPGHHPLNSYLPPLPPPPALPPGGHLGHIQMLPPPPGPPPDRMNYAPPSHMHASPSTHLAAPVTGPTGLAEPRPDVQPVIAAKSTVVTLPRAQHDKKVTSMVPSSLLARRPAKKADGGSSSRGAAAISAPGFGLVPRSVTSVTAKAREEIAPDVSAGRGSGGGDNQKKEVGDDSYESFMNSMKKLGAL